MEAALVQGGTPICGKSFLSSNRGQNMTGLALQKWRAIPYEG